MTDNKLSDRLRERTTMTTDLIGGGNEMLLEAAETIDRLEKREPTFEEKLALTKPYDPVTSPRLDLTPNEDAAWDAAMQKPPSADERLAALLPYVQHKPECWAREDVGNDVL